MSVKQINTLIFNTALTNDELTSILDAVRFKRASLANQIKCTVRKGDNVQFTSNRNGRTFRGFVTKMAIKYATVDTGMGLYKVPMNMLSVVDESA
jgi:hypothetical protein